MTDSNTPDCEKYVAPDPPHFWIPGMHIIDGRSYLLDTAVRFIFQYPVRITEKLDGLRKAIKVGHFVLAVEDMLYRQSIFYRVPSRYAVSDIFDRKRGLFLDSYGTKTVMKDLSKGILREAGVVADSFFPVPLVAEGRYELASLPGLAGKSAYGVDEVTGSPVQAAGIVVKHDIEHMQWFYVYGVLMAEDVPGYNVVKCPVTGTENLLDQSIQYSW